MRKAGGRAVPRPATGLRLLLAACLALVVSRASADLGAGGLGTGMGQVAGVGGGGGDPATSPPPMQHHSSPPPSTTSARAAAADAADGADADSDYYVEGTAIILDTRAEGAIVSVVQQALLALPSSWQVVIMHSAANEIPLRLAMHGFSARHRARLSLVRTEHDMANGNEPASNFAMWYLSAGKMMTFQTDGAFCVGLPEEDGDGDGDGDGGTADEDSRSGAAKQPGDAMKDVGEQGGVVQSSRPEPVGGGGGPLTRAEAAAKLAAVLPFDYAGPAWRDPSSLTVHGQGGNGGFCVRSKRASLHLMRTFPLSKYVAWGQGRASLSLNEDAYFSYLLPFINATIAPPSVVKDFAVEAVWDGTSSPLAVHAPWFHLDVVSLGRMIRRCPAAAPTLFDAMAKYVRKEGTEAAEKEQARREALDAAVWGPARAASNAIAGAGLTTGVVGTKVGTAGSSTFSSSYLPSTSAPSPSPSVPPPPPPPPHAMPYEPASSYEFLDATYNAVARAGSSRGAVRARVLKPVYRLVWESLPGHIEMGSGVGDGGGGGGGAAGAVVADGGDGGNDDGSAGGGGAGE